MQNANLFFSRFFRPPAIVVMMLVLGALFGLPFQGAPANAADSVDGMDPAGRVGRIASLSGTVTLSNRQTGESFTVPLNQPLTSGDVLHSEPGARAEIEIGSLTVRLDAQSELELTQVDDERIRISLNDGRAIVRVATRDTLNDFELSSRDARFLARDTGVYRFDTDARSTVATVYAGSLQGESGRNAVDVPVGEGAQFWIDDGAQGTAHYRLVPAMDDDFTQWSEARDQQSGGPGAVTRANYSRYVSPEMTGAADLDAYGDWSETPEYGAIWLPRRVSPDWAPYRDGRWVWVQPWGWNWVGDEPWGFAPYHYGRWLRYRGTWAWVPGARVVRPVYSPAMVAWVGSSGASLSFSFNTRTGPDVRWFPLAPHEVYVPIFRSSPRYVRSVNQPHVARIDNFTIIANRPQDAMRYGEHENREWQQTGGRAPFEPRRMAPRPVQNDAPRAVEVRPSRSFVRELSPLPSVNAVPAPSPAVRPPRDDRPDDRAMTPSQPNGFRVRQPEASPSQDQGQNQNRLNHEQPPRSSGQGEARPDWKRAASPTPAPQPVAVPERSAQPERDQNSPRNEAPPAFAPRSEVQDRARERDAGDPHRNKDDEDWRRKHPKNER